jgi:hypothetical protein
MSAKPDLSSDAGIKRAVAVIFWYAYQAVTVRGWSEARGEWDSLQYPLEAQFCREHFDGIQPRYAVNVPPVFAYHAAPPAVRGALIRRAHQPFHDAGCCIFVPWPSCDMFNSMFPSVAAAADASDVPVVTLLLGNLPIGTTPEQIRFKVFVPTHIDPEVVCVHKTAHTANAQDVAGINLCKFKKGKPAKRLGDAQSVRITVPAAAADFIKRALHKRVLVDSDGFLICKPDRDSALLFRCMIELRKHDPTARCQSLAHDALTCIDATN